MHQPRRLIANAANSLRRKKKSEFGLSVSQWKKRNKSRKMVQITGRYQYVSGENFEEYLKAIGQYDVAKPFLNSQPVVEISQNGDQWVVAIESNGKTAATTFKLGEEYDENMPSFSGTLKSITTKDGDKFVTETKLGEGIKSVRVYEFSDTGMTVHLTESKTGAKATRTYKRL